MIDELKDRFGREYKPGIIFGFISSGTKSTRITLALVTEIKNNRIYAIRLGWDNRIIKCGHIKTENAIIIDPTINNSEIKELMKLSNKLESSIYRCITIY